MLLNCKKTIPWLFILMVSITPFQTSIASDMPAMNHPVPMSAEHINMQIPEKQEISRLMDCCFLTDHCLGDPLFNCAAQTSSSLHGTNYFALARRTGIFLINQLQSDAVKTQYPELLERPPKA